MRAIWKTAGIKAAGVGLSLAVVSGAYWAGVAIFSPDTSEVSDVYTVPTPTETTTVEPTVEQVSPAVVTPEPAGGAEQGTTGGESSPPVAEPDQPVQPPAPAPEPPPYYEPPANPGEPGRGDPGPSIPDAAPVPWEPGYPTN